MHLLILHWDPREDPAILIHLRKSFILSRGFFPLSASSHEINQSRPPSRLNQLGSSFLSSCKLPPDLHAPSEKSLKHEKVTFYNEDLHLKNIFKKKFSRKIFHSFSRFDQPIPSSFSSKDSSSSDQSSFSETLSSKKLHLFFHQILFLLDSSSLQPLNKSTWFHLL